MPRYDDYSREELVRLLKAGDRRDATRFGLVWERNEVEREPKLNGDFVALDLDAALSTVPTTGTEGSDAAWQVETIPQSLALTFGLGRERA